MYKSLSKFGMFFWTMAGKSATVQCAKLHGVRTSLFSLIGGSMMIEPVTGRTPLLPIIPKRHRVSKELERKKIGGHASSLKLNLTDPWRTVPCQYHGWGMPGRWAVSSIAVYARVQCREPKTGQEKGSILLQRRFAFPSFLLFIYAKK